MTHHYFDFVQARQNMVENQLRPAEVNNVKLIEIIRVLPREECVLKNQKEIAYSDINIPLFDNRFLSEPRVTARLIQLANVQSQQKILVVGAGTGYLPVILSLMGAKVYALEENEELLAFGKNFCNQYASNIHIEKGKLSEGLPQYKYFDTILIDGSVPAIPEKLIDQLAKNGHIVTVLKKIGDIGHAVIAKKVEENVTIQEHFYAALPYLPELI